LELPAGVQRRILGNIVAALRAQGITIDLI